MKKLSFLGGGFRRRSGVTGVSATAGARVRAEVALTRSVRPGRVARFGAVLLIVTALVGGGVAPASADVGDIPPIDIPPIPGLPDPPSTHELIRANSWYRFRFALERKMLTVPSSFLQSLGVHGAHAQAAWLYSAEKVGGASVEKLNNMQTYSTLNPPPGTTPQTYQDYVLRHHDFATPIVEDPRTGEKKLQVSPTRGQKFQRVAGGAVQALGAATFVPLVTHGGLGFTGSWFGQEDALGQFCMSEPEDVGGNVVWHTLNILTGLSCSEMMAIDPEVFEASEIDSWCLNPEVSGAAEAFCVSRIATVYNLYNIPFYCFQSTAKNVPSGWEIRFEIKRFDGRSELQNYTSLRPFSQLFQKCRELRPATAFGHDRIISPALDPSTFRIYYRELSTGETHEGYVAPTSVEQLECVITLTDGRTLRSVGGEFDPSTGQMSPPPCPNVPDGATVASVGVNDSQGNEIYKEDSSPEYLDWRQKYPECFEGACLLDLRLKDGAKLGASCFQLDEACADWWTDPSRNTKYQCTYGVHNVEIEECAIYAGIFQPGRLQVGAPYSDPMTGNWDGSANAPRPEKMDQKAMAQALQNPASVRGCTGMNIKGFDPVGFVMRPVQCALEWAFVPRPLVVELEMRGAERAWEKKPPKVIADAVAAFQLTPAVSGCSRTVTIFAGQFQSSVTPINVCPGTPGAVVADVSRVVTTVAMVVLVVVIVRRQIAGMVGYGAGQ